MRSARHDATTRRRTSRCPTSPTSCTGITLRSPPPRSGESTSGMRAVDGAPRVAGPRHGRTVATARARCVPAFGLLGTASELGGGHGANARLRTRSPPSTTHPATRTRHGCVAGRRMQWTRCRAVRGGSERWRRWRTPGRPPYRCAATGARRWGGFALGVGAH